jgi:HlyD family secretion protein
MESKIFRKVALERLSNPEQLDQLLQVTTPRDWLALLGLFSVLLAVIIWAAIGQIQTKAAGQGVLVRSGTVLNVVTVGSGLVTSVYVKAGDRVKPNQLLAKVAEPSEMEKVRLAKEALEEALRGRELSATLRGREAKLHVDALERSRVNAENQIKQLRQQTKLTAEQTSVDQQLLAKGLVTREYTLTTEQKLSTLNGQIEELEAQIKQFDAEIFIAKSDPIESDAQTRKEIAEKQRSLTVLESELERATNVVSPFAGQVVELNAAEGTLVEAGFPILSIQPEAQQLEVIMYVPSETAKAIAPGMEAQISPSIVKREEYGFIRSKVTYVAEFPATTATMMRNFENQTLVQALLGSGPVTELQLALAPDATNYSGFRWSSGKGPPIKLSSGTMCTGQVVIREQRPFTLLFPYVKEKLGLT